MSVPARAATRHIAIIGTQLPYRCGIAICTTALAAALVGADPATAYDVLAVNRHGGGPCLPAARHRHARPARSRGRPLALNTRNVELALLRYEYGIFGGPAGEHLLALLQDLRAPVGTTLHTVLREPSAAPRDDPLAVRAQQ